MKPQSATAKQPENPAQVQRPAAPPPPSLEQQISQVAGYFMSHAMSEDQQSRAHEVRQAGQLLAETILKCVKPCADQTAAIRKIRECTMTVVQAISLEEYGK